jgi:hypothetical protein
MKKIIINTIVKMVFFSVLIVSCSKASEMKKYDELGWNKYSNAKYGYEIYYPNDCALWPTGTEPERDGATIRIALKDHEALVPFLDVSIEPRVSTEEFLKSWNEIKDMTLERSEVVIDGISAIIIEYRWKINGNIAYINILRDGITFSFHAGGGISNFEETKWWEIINSFHKA